MELVLAYVFVILLTWRKEQLPVSGGEYLSHEFRRLLAPSGKLLCPVIHGGTVGVVGKGRLTPAVAVALFASFSCS